jgi:hypothetical protein
MKASIFIYVGVLALAIFNGVFSSYSFLIFALQGIWYPPVLPAPLNIMFVLSGLISGIFHLLVTGVPAALLDKFLALKAPTTGLVWLAAMLVPTIKTLFHIGWL